jgi:CHASE1-domain containing sensor protein
VTIGTGADTRASSPATSRFTARRLRSAFGLWRGSVRRTDFLICSIFVALSLGLGAYVYARAHAAARLEFSRQAQALQAAITKSLNDPLEDLSALRDCLRRRTVTRKQFRLSTEPLLGRHRRVYAFSGCGGPGAKAQRARGATRAAGLSALRSGVRSRTGPRGRRAPRDPIQYMEAAQLARARPRHRASADPGRPR